MDTFPTLPGLTWSVIKSPKFATRIQTSVSGRELRSLDQPYPIWTWTLTYDFLRDGNDKHAGNALGTGYNELRTIMGFFLKQQASFQQFLYVDPTDNTLNNSGIGFGDGSNKQFQLVRFMGAGAAGFFEPITQPVNLFAVYVNGVLSPFPSAWTLGSYGVVNFVSPPANGAAITADFTYAFPVRFADDTYDFENFMYQLWSLKQIKFQSVLLP